MFLDQGFVDDGKPALEALVELVFGAIVLNRDVFVVELREGDALVLVKLSGVGRKCPILGLLSFLLFHFACLKMRQMEVEACVLFRALMAAFGC